MGSIPVAGAIGATIWLPLIIHYQFCWVSNMRNEDILKLINRCNIENGLILIEGYAYLFNIKRRQRCGNHYEYITEEIIVLFKNGEKAGGIYRMGSYNLHWVIKKKYQGQHILSDFLRTGILNNVWSENKSVEICGVYTRADYNKKKHLALLAGMSIRNEEKIESLLTYLRQ